jgi:hypothetical protein
MKSCLALTTYDCLHLIPFLDLFDVDFIEEVGRIISNPFGVLLYEDNYISEFLNSKLNGIHYVNDIEGVKFSYIFNSTNKSIVINSNYNNIFVL